MIEVEQNKHAKRLLMAARKLGDGWLQAPDHQDMRVQLQALFSEDYLDALMAAEFPLFLGQKLEGLDRQAGDEFVDEAYERGLMLSDGAAEPLLRRLRGIRLDVLRELAIYCDCPKLAKMIDDLEPEPQTAPAKPNTVEVGQVAAPATPGKTSIPEWLNVTSDYIAGLMKEGRYGTAKELFNALEAKAGTDSPFEKGAVQNRGSLYVRAIAATVTLKTMQNNWSKIRSLTR